MNPDINQTLPTQCPICGQAHSLTVTRFACSACGSAVEGRFVADPPFKALNAEQLRFVELFVRCEGKLNRMEEELGLSYPTIRARLSEVVRAMGFEPGRDEPPAPPAAPAPPPPPRAVTRKQILDDLEKGKLTAAQATAMLAQLKGG